MEIKIIPKRDLKQVVEVHKNSFEGFFLTELGDDFLALYYDCVRIDEKGVLLGCYEEGELLGFCAATTLSKGFNKGLIQKNLFKFSLVGLRLLFTRVPSLIRLFKNLSKKSSTIDDTGEYADLLSIGISARKQGLGIGKKLLLQLEKEIELKGCTKLSLTTDYYNNDKALGFYKGTGYEIYYDFIAYPERKMYRMIKKIN
ncbi:MAG: GNAT family N-acetyltransferase [Ginsengibacter sp.]